MDNIIRVDNLTFEYPEQEQLFKKLSLSIERGSWTAIIGQNGSGKSTLARLIDGLLEAESGTITVDGKVVNEDNLDFVRESIGMVFQNPEDQFVGATVEDDVAFGLENRQVSRPSMIETVQKRLKDVGMWDYRESVPANLSGGQKQRVAIAGILAVNPKILILDEATSMLDPKGRQDVLKLVAELKEKNNLTVISITHDIDEAALASRVLVLNRGKLLVDDIPSNVFNDEEKLVELGLDAPFTTRLANRLSERNVSMPDKYSNKEELVQWIMQLNSKR
ncbi:energy-coupling factor transporter ATPase [Lentilactobacillus sp. Marseille-Q4993]|uniref:energy-coupling factor transporter ATPase n=1 Tax=Lentilactobacillus sp. Marseille-Q4993 TaxID=3039492 RepID=UPI0024BC5D33|nr:energy-coupling factor transporter ATPase [Lentilactobacillus sp. Marseille-Q4993]